MTIFIIFNINHALFSHSSHPPLLDPSFAETMKESPSQIWTVGDRRWTVEDEVRYGQWVEKNITEDFFIRYKIPIDCADVPYAVRWIYARIAHLPAAATTKDGKLIGHWSTDLGKLPTHPEWHKDVRFRKALFHMLTETTTRTLPLDTYPVRIDPESITPGTAFFITESHSGIIGRIILDGSSIHPLQTWEATSPVKFQKMSERDFLTPRPESTIYSGLVKFRWPVFENRQWRYLPVKEHPYYSLEQYSGSFTEEYTDFVEAVAKRIDPLDYPSGTKWKKFWIIRFIMPGRGSLLFWKDTNGVAREVVRRVQSSGRFTAHRTVTGRLSYSWITSIISSNRMV
jgi:hypothetical protein